MKPLGSVTTIFPRDQSSRTGTPHGGRGLATPDASPELVAWLANHSPAEVDKAAVSQALRRGVGLEVKYDYRFPKDEKGNSLPMVVICKGCGVSGDEEGQALALADLRKLQAPADVRMIEGWLAELSVVTAKRSDDEFTEELRLEAYASRLRKFPADVARAAVLDSPPKFWPTWNELEARCKSLSSPRNVMIAALENNSPRQVTEDRERVTAARAAEIMREVWGEDE